MTTDELRGLIAKATPGPYFVEDNGGNTRPQMWTRNSEDGLALICEFDAALMDDNQDRWNAEAFTALLNALPQLLDRIQVLESENAAMKERLANSIQFAGGVSPIAVQAGGFAG